MSAASSLSGPSSAPPMPDFPSFYRSINGREPFPWQARLAEQIERTEEWPPEIGVPTGLGKTACLDIAVWWLASQADRPPASRSAPTRIWWVVNRRLLVDSTAQHADEIAAALRDPATAGLNREDAATVAAVADRLRSLSSVPVEEPLEVIPLRGGVRTRTPSDPSRPAVILSTVPMYGSRILFRGYGTSRGMRPIDAAMAGTDSLVLFDEAHLAPHLRTLCDALQECAPPKQTFLPGSRSRPRIAALTATGGAKGVARFDLDDRDLAHPVVRRRLEARKPLELRECHKATEVARHLAAAMGDLLGAAPGPASGVVFANTPKTARSAFGHLRKTMRTTAEVLLLTGRAREREAERTRDTILDPVDGMASRREAGRPRDRHLVVVATQTLEVGADLDAEYLVTENCGVRALTQRLGRLNRLGRHSHARAIYLHAPPPERPRRKAAVKADAAEWPVYLQEPEVVWNRLREAREASASGVPDLCPGGIRALLGDPADDPGRSPEILFGLLWEWIKTTTPPAGEAPVEPYFSGIAGQDRLVSLIWRAYLPEDEGTLWPRPRDRESVSVPISEIRETLKPEETLLRLRPDRLTVEVVARNRLRPGDSLVLPSDRGLLDEFGWNPDSSSPVVDVSLGDNGLPLDSVAIERLRGPGILTTLIQTATGLDPDGERLDPEEQRDAANTILRTLREGPVPHGWEEPKWTAFVDALSHEAQMPRGEVARLRVETGRGTEERSDEFDEISLADDEVTLDRHGREVALRARTIADRLGIPSDLADAVERAGSLHDLGKADERFQTWLHDGPAPPEVVLAKSGMPRHRWASARVEAGWPRGGRHEALSARLVERWLEQATDWGDPALRDLLLHLVVSHHGHGRPLVPPVTDRAPAVVSGEISGRAVEASSDLSEVDWAQPARFRRLNEEYGPWGLALLESVVRLADHAVSGHSTARRSGGSAR